MSASAASVPDSSPVKTVPGLVELIELLTTIKKDTHRFVKYASDEDYEIFRNVIAMKYPQALLVQMFAIPYFKPVLVKIHGSVEPCDVKHEITDIPEPIEGMDSFIIGVKLDKDMNKRFAARVSFSADKIIVTSAPLKESLPAVPPGWEYVKDD